MSKLRQPTSSSVSVVFNLVGGNLQKRKKEGGRLVGCVLTYFLNNTKERPKNGASAVTRVKALPTVLKGTKEKAVWA